MKADYTIRTLDKQCGRRKGNCYIMKFGDKLKAARLNSNLTQTQLASQVGLTKRTIINYETGTSYPRDRKIYSMLANTLNIELNHLLTEDEEFITETSSKYGSRGETEARELLARTSAMFAGGDLDDEDKLAFLLEIQELYLQAKEIARKKYNSKKAKKE